MQWGAKQVAQWQEVQKNKLSSGATNIQRCQATDTLWIPPVAGGLKINVDASVYGGSSSFSVGMVLRDYRGGFCKARIARRTCDVSVFEAETWGVLQAIRWIKDLGISNVVVESDSMITVQNFNRGTANFLEVGNMLKEGRELISTRSDISVSFVKKQANRVSHMLARVSCEANSFKDFSSPPHLVLENLMYDVSLI